MAVAAMARGWRLGLATRTVRHFQLAVAFALAAVAVGFLLYFVEKSLLRLENRFVENPASVMMRACGLAHFWIGWLFLFTSPALRQRSAQLRLLGLIALGVALCALCALGGASQNPFVFLFFYSFFLVHEIRDETKLYQRCGDAPLDGDRSQQFLQSASLAMAVICSSLLLVTYLSHALLIKRLPLLVSLSPFYYVTAGFCLLCLNLHVGQRAVLAARQQYGSLRQALTHHSPIALVYLGIFSVLLLGLAAGSASFNLIILIHAGAWLVFIGYQLGQKPPPAQQTWWTWLRYTPTGFLTLHLLVIGFILLMMALRVHLWQRVGLVSELFAGGNFPYWSLMHITMALWRPR
jgi:hypothetical protein